MKTLALPLALVALFPASALGASWSAPADVVPDASTPNVYVSGSESLILAGSGAQALLARGTAAGAFGSPVPVASTSGAALGLTSALGPDGTLAVAWAAGGGAHVSVVKPSGDVLTEAALPGTGVNSLAVAIGSGGDIVVAYRTKEGANAYTLRVATMPAGTATFGAPVVLHSGGAVDSIAMAAGPNGALAIAYRQLGGKYRARVAVRPAGGGAFAEGTPMSRAAGDGDDYSPRVAFDADGTLVAAWGNAGGALYALRGPGAGAFGEAQALGTGPAYDVDLVRAPATGGAAVAFAGNGTVWAATQGAPGGAFSAPVPVGPTFSSPLSVDVATTAAPDGTVTTVFADPTTGAVHAVDAGGADTIVGYGSRDGVTPVATASSADRTLAAWTTAGGTVAAATRSATTRAATPTDLGTPPAARDLTPPKLTLVGAPKRLNVTARTTSITLKARCSEACRFFVTGNLRTTRRGAKRQRVAPLPPLSTKTPRTGTQKLPLKLGGFAQKDLRAALKQRRGAQLFLVVEASDANGNATRKRVQITLKPAPAKHRR